jgi:hypothetical protein
MLSTLNLIAIMCGAAGIIMVIGSMLLLYQGVIKLGEKSTSTALEAEFKDQLKINIRNPALGLFAVGFLFFVVALYFAKREQAEPLLITAHLRIADSQDVPQGVIAKLQAEETPITVSSEGEIHTTIQPLEKLLIVVQAPGYRPPTLVEKINPSEVKNGRIEINLHPFVRLPGAILTEPRLENTQRPTP